jgi:hypothetical protein
MKKILGIALTIGILSTSASAGVVTSITNEGSVTIIKCSTLQKDIKVYNNSNGKCTNNRIFGDYECGWLMKESLKWCKDN